jgi:predicted GNAT superfamily acetyltransferase
VPGHYTLSALPPDKVLVSVPEELPYGQSGDVAAVEALQDRVRDEFLQAFANGYTAVAVSRIGAPMYILVREAD